MRRKIKKIVMVVVLCFSVILSVPSLINAKTMFEIIYGNQVTGSNMRVYDATELSDSSVILAGSLTERDVYVAKMDAAGELTWSTTLHATAYTYLNAVTVLDDGTIIAVGYTGGSFEGNISNNRDNGIIVALDSEGQMLWTRQIGGTYSNYFYGVATDGESIVIAGETFGSIPGHSSLGDIDAVIFKYDKNGNQQWSRQVGGTGKDRYRAIAVDKSNDIILGGTTTGSFSGNTHAGGEDSVLSKYSMNGTHVWTKQFGTTLSESISKIHIGEDNDIYLAESVINSEYKGKAFVYRLDNNGSLKWSDEFGDFTHYFSIGDISTTSNGQLLVVGHGSEPGDSYYGDFQVFVQEYDINGNEVRSGIFGTEGSDNACLITGLEQNQIKVVGYTSDSWFGSNTNQLNPFMIILGDVDYFNVIFNTDGGSLIEEQEVQAGQQASMPSDPEKDNYTFAGWYQDEALTQTFDFTQVILKDTTIYAKWESSVLPVEQVEVNFETNGGSSIESETIEAGQKVTQPSDPKKDNHIFAGWYQDEDLTQTFDFTQVILKDTTIYAKWESSVLPVEQVEVNFETNGGSSIESETLEAGQQVTQPSDPEKDNYTFAGWYQDEALTQTFDFTQVILKDTTIYAKWEAENTDVDQKPTLPNTGVMNSPIGRVMIMLGLVSLGGTYLVSKRKIRQDNNE